MSADELPTTETGGAATDGDLDIEVVDNPDAHRWELRQGDRLLGLARYAIVPASEASPERVVFFHTEVRPEYEGRGLASVLARRALDATMGSGRTVVAMCPYIRAWVRRHRDPYAEHVSAPTRADVEAVNHAVGGAAGA